MLSHSSILTMCLTRAPCPRSGQSENSPPPPSSPSELRQTIVVTFVNPIRELEVCDVWQAWRAESSAHGPVLRWGWWRCAFHLRFPVVSPLGTLRPMNTESNQGPECSVYWPIYGCWLHKMQSLQSTGNILMCLSGSSQRVSAGLLQLYPLWSRLSTFPDQEKYCVWCVSPSTSCLWVFVPKGGCYSDTSRLKGSAEADSCGTLVTTYRTGPQIKVYLSRRTWALLANGGGSSYTLLYSKICRKPVACLSISQPDLDNIDFTSCI